MQLLQKEIPQYRQLYAILKSQMVKGAYTPGDLLPSENALCKTYHLTRPTVRQALGELVNEGYIKKIKGKGSVVQKKKAGIGILNIKGTTDSVPTGKLVTQVIDPPQLTSWDEALEYEISAAEKEVGCISMSRLRLLDEQPIFYEETYLPNLNLPRFTSRNFNNQSLFGTLLHHYNLKVTGGTQRIRAIPAATTICELLQVPPKSPILYLEKRYETSRPYFHFYTSIWCQTEHYYLEGAL